MNKLCTKGLEIHNFLLPRPSRHSKILRHGHPVPSENVVQYLANLQNPEEKCLPIHHIGWHHPWIRMEHFEKKFAAWNTARRPEIVWLSGCHHAKLMCNKMWRPEMVISFRQLVFCSQDGFKPTYQRWLLTPTSSNREDFRSKTLRFLCRQLPYFEIWNHPREWFQAMSQRGFLRRNSQHPDAKQVLEKNPRVHELTSDLATCDYLEFLLQWWSDFKNAPNTLGTTEINKDFKHKPFSTRLPCLAVTRNQNLSQASGLKCHTVYPGQNIYII